jgi:Zn/Cd-binding protein ZinT
MTRNSYILIAVVCAGGALAQNSSWPSFSGTWALDTDSSEKLMVEQAGAEIHIQETKGGQTAADYKCNLDGRECTFKENGHAGKVAFWFNGPKLVELKTNGNKVVRRRFTIAEEGKKLEIELSLVSPPGKSETLAYERQ